MKANLFGILLFIAVLIGLRALNAETLAGYVSGLATTFILGIVSVVGIRLTYED